MYTAFAIAYYTTNPNSVKTKTSAMNGGPDRICICGSGQLRKHPAVSDRQKSYLPISFYYQSSISFVIRASISMPFFICSDLVPSVPYSTLYLAFLRSTMWAICFFLPTLSSPFGDMLVMHVHPSAVETVEPHCNRRGPARIAAPLMSENVRKTSFPFAFYLLNRTLIFGQCRLHLRKTQINLVFCSVCTTFAAAN